MKRVLSVLTAAGLALSLAACGSSASSAASSEAAPAAGFDTTQAITVISREDGSGTRGAFIELTGVEAKDADGNKVDNTTVDAAIANSTNNVMQGVQADETAIGYISMGSLNDTVKAVTVDGVACSEDTVLDGSYAIQRPFVLVTKDGAALSAQAQAFFDFATSADASDLIRAAGAVPVAK